MSERAAGSKAEDECFWEEYERKKLKPQNKKPFLILLKVVLLWHVRSSSSVESETLG